jgi:PTS system mannose-specific IID component
MNNIANTFFRTFFIQGAWNFMKFQNFGLSFCLFPHLKRIHKNDNDLKKAVLRHFEIFNTQPYMASFVIGNIVFMEEKFNEFGEERLRQIKQSLACAFASIGDRIFWARLRITTFLLTLILYFALSLNQNSFSNNYIIFLSLIIPTAIYDIFSLYIRYYGLKKGYTSSSVSYCGLDFLNWNKIIRNLSYFNFAIMLTVIIMLISTALVYRIGFSNINNIFLLQIIFLILTIMMQRYFRQKKHKFILLIIGVFFLSVLFNFIMGFLKLC